MSIKFDRMQIEYINIRSTRGNRSEASYQNSIVEVPKKETFSYVFDNAKNGNEFAAVMLDEWQKNCQPKNEEEQRIVHMINLAANRLFK
jgi:hypothetical protein